MTLNDRNERLRQFFGGYFHQDWDVEGATSWVDVAIAYVKEVPRADVIALLNDLRSWVHEATTNPTPGENLPQSFGCEYDSWRDAVNDREWVQQIVELIDKQIASQ